MGVVDTLLGRVPTVDFAAEPPTEKPLTGFDDAIQREIAVARATMWIAREAETIPGVRKALHVICGTVGTFTLAAWKGATRLPDSAHPWLQQPDPRVTSQRLLTQTVRDGIWHDYAVWRQVPGGYRRLQPDRVVRVPDPTNPEDDAAGLAGWYLDGQRLGEADLHNNYVIFDWCGLGGLRRWGAPLLQMYITVQAAAARYADEPIPSGTLKNTGMDLRPEGIEELLSGWEAARAARATAYLNATTDFHGEQYNLRDLQLVELSEAMVKDIARLFGLPAPALNTSSGESLTYSTLVDYRRDILEALRPWYAPVEQTLSLDEYAVTLSSSGASATRRGRYVPYGTAVRFDTTEYLRDPFATRIATLAQAIAATGPAGDPLMTVPEARALEPLIPSPVPGADAP